MISQMDDSTKVNRFVPSDDDDEENTEYRDCNLNDNINNNNSNEKPDSFESFSTISRSSSSSSSSLPYPPEERFVQKYLVKIIMNSVRKDGGIVYFTLITKLNENNSPNDEIRVCRQYDDFVYLHHCLITSYLPSYGIIIPPLPEQPSLNLVDATVKSKHKLGASTRTIIPDEWHKDCWHLQEYLRLMLSHKLYGRNEIWKKFLLEKEAPIRVKIKKTFGIIERISDGLERAKANHKDCDEFFQNERDWLQGYFNEFKNFTERFNSIIHARLKLCGVLAHLSTLINVNLDDCDSNSSRSSTSNLFSLALDDYRDGLLIINHNDEATLGALLELWLKYLEAEKEMLLKRTCLLVDYENANRLFDKAKPTKKDMAQQHKVEAEKLFEECSEMAREEIKAFNKERRAALSNGIVKYSEAQLLVNRDILLVLEKSLQVMKKIQI